MDVNRMGLTSSIMAKSNNQVVGNGRPISFLAKLPAGKLSSGPVCAALLNNVRPWSEGAATNTKGDNGD